MTAAARIPLERAVRPQDVRSAESRGAGEYHRRCVPTDADIRRAWNAHGGTHEALAAWFRDKGWKCSRQKVTKALAPDDALLRRLLASQPPVKAQIVPVAIAEPQAWQPQRDIIDGPCQPFSPLVARRRVFWLAYDAGWLCFLGGGVVSQAVPGIGGAFMLFSLVCWLYACECV